MGSSTSSNQTNSKVLNTTTSTTTTTDNYNNNDICRNINKNTSKATSKLEFCMEQAVENTFKGFLLGSVMELILIRRSNVAISNELKASNSTNIDLINQKPTANCKIISLTASFKRLYYICMYEWVYTLSDDSLIMFI